MSQTRTMNNERAGCAKPSPRGKLAKHDLKKVRNGGMIVLFGVFLTAGIEALMHVDFGRWDLVVSGVLMIAANLVRKLFTDTSEN